jgi:hypothetical protein
MIYQIKIKGELDQSWSDWLGDVEIISEPQGDGSVITRLTVDAADQSTLFGILDQVRDLNLTLINVISKEDDAEMKR